MQIETTSKFNNAQSFSDSFKSYFWERADRSGDCWIWEGCLSGVGYGVLTYNTKRYNAHRISWVLTFGPIPEGLWVLHSCDNRACVNPFHLFLGTAQDNTNDMLAKGRDRFFSRRDPRHRLTWQKACMIRDLLKTGSYSYPDLAAMFGVTVTTIAHVRHFKSWRRPHN